MGVNATFGDFPVEDEKTKKTIGIRKDFKAGSIRSLIELEKPRVSEAVLPNKRRSVKFVTDCNSSLITSIVQGTGECVILTELGATTGETKGSANCFNTRD
ncbi:hypothetical protein WICPIJ_003401 [Wickerhamomyces pijperi]|uniref:Uncharacterized protein n=1 Tax=Wickerhamomyces pijperi TaxID=599730 RepID=A0A9P8TNX9_WICPI|nr:hypothetical protein WICPIJ_003401 [Wickerhamomyces pijperi]